MRIGIGEQPVGQKGRSFDAQVPDIIQATELGQVELFILGYDSFEQLRTGQGRLAIGSRIISAVEDPPVSVSGDLAPDTTNGIGQHEGRGGGIVQMPEGNSILFSIIPDSQGGADQTSVKGQSAEGEEGFDGISYKIVPGLQAVEDLGSGKAEDGSEDRHIPYPVVGPDPYFSFLRRR